MYQLGAREFRHVLTELYVQLPKPNACKLHCRWPAGRPARAEHPGTVKRGRLLF